MIAFAYESQIKIHSQLLLKIHTKHKCYWVVPHSPVHYCPYGLKITRMSASVAVHVAVESERV